MDQTSLGVAGPAPEAFQQPTADTPAPAAGEVNTGKPADVPITPPVSEAVQTTETDESAIAAATEAANRAKSTGIVPVTSLPDGDIVALARSQGISLTGVTSSDGSVDRDGAIRVLSMHGIREVNTNPQS